MSMEISRCHPANEQHSDVTWFTIDVIPQYESILWKRWSIVGTLLPFCRNPFKVEGFHKWSPEMIQIPRQSRKTRCLDTARYTPRGRGSTEGSTVVHDPVSHNHRSGTLPYMKGNKYWRYTHFPRNHDYESGWVGGGNSNSFYFFIPIVGEDVPIWLAHIYQMRWFNHQLVKIIRKLNMYRLDLSPPNPGFQSPPGSLHF